jgi:L-malate glycosyltransferase
MRILMITPHFYPSRGGMERQALQLAKELVQRGILVDVVTARHPGQSPFERVQGIPVYRNAGRGEGYLSLALYLSSLFAFLISRGRRYDLFHVHQALYSAFVAVLAGRWLRIQTLVKVTGTGPSGNVAVLRNRRSGRFLTAMVRHADVMISLSDEAAHEIRSIGFTGRLENIPNGVDTDQFRPTCRPEDMRRQLNLPEGQLIFHAGRLSPEKGQDLLVQAMPQVLARCPDAWLAMAGNGPTRRLLEEAVVRLGVASRVRMISEVDDIAPYLAAADVFVLPSRGEGMSNALLEAMATGLPCLASDVGGNREVIRHGENGWLVPSGDTVALAEGLCALLSDKELAARLGKNARATVEREFSFDRVADRYAALYADMLKGQHAAD